MEVLMNSTISPRTNRLLDALPAAEAAYVLASSELIALPVRSILYESGVRPKYAYFLTDGIASVVRNTEAGAVIDVGIIGQEGLVGAIHLLGPLELPTQCFMQIAGSGRRMLLTELERLFSAPSAIHDRISEFIQFRMINASQLVACSASHSVEKRFARWLLDIQDRVHEGRFALTHEFIAEMLAVQRPTLSMIAKRFQAAEMIAYRHGHIRILDGAGLESIACECYGITHSLLTRLYSQASESRPPGSFPDRHHAYVANGVAAA